MSEQQYRIEPQMNWVMALCGVIAFVAGVASLALPWLDPELRGPGAGLVVLLAGPISLGAAWYCLRFVVRRQDYGIVLDAEGFRRLSDEPTHVVPWSRIARLRERRVLNRVELLDHTGRVLGRMEYQLEGFEEALAVVLDAIRYEERLVLPRRIEAGPAMGNRVAGALLLTLVAFAFWFAEPVPALLLLVVLGWVFIKDRASTRSALQVDDKAVQLAGANAITLAADQLEDVRVVRKPVQNGGYALDVALRTTGGEIHRVRPEQADPFLVWAMLRTAIRRARPAVAATPQALPGRERLASGQARQVMLAMVLLFALAFGHSWLLKSMAPPIGVATEAPEFQARVLLTGEEISFPAAGQGQVVVLSFWDYECTYCRGQLAALDSVRQLVDTGRVRVVAIHIGNPDSGAAMVRDLHLSLDLWQDVDGRAAQRYGIQGTPATLVVDSSRCVRYFITGTGGVAVKRLARAASEVVGEPLRSCESAIPANPPSGTRLAAG